VIFNPKMGSSLWGAVHQPLFIFLPPSSSTLSGGKDKKGEEYLRAKPLEIRGWSGGKRYVARGEGGGVD
jgi:hypothetical protein